MPADQRGRGVGAEVALARRESPHQGSRLLGLARTLVTGMPHTLAALDSGVINEWRATLIVRETICLSAENRHAMDTELAAHPGALEGVGTQGLKNRARKIALRLEPEAAVARARKAATERYVSCRPAPDTMAYLTALLPAAEAISAYSALSRHADTQLTAGDDRGRGRGQLMADAVVERLTGAPAGSVRTDVQLIMTDRTLLQGDSEPAYLPGYGSVPAQYARDLLRGCPGRHGGSGANTANPGRGGHSGRSGHDRPYEQSGHQQHRWGRQYQQYRRGRQYQQYRRGRQYQQYRRGRQYQQYRRGRQYQQYRRGRQYQQYRRGRQYQQRRRGLRPCRSGMAPSALHRPGHRRTGGNGLPGPALSTRAPPPDRCEGRDLPHPVL